MNRAKYYVFLLLLSPILLADYLANIHHIERDSFLEVLQHSYFCTLTKIGAKKINIKLI